VADYLHGEPCQQHRKNGETQHLVLRHGFTPACVPQHSIDTSDDSLLMPLAARQRYLTRRVAPLTCP
jgi:hypothetical protein